MASINSKMYIPESIANISTKDIYLWFDNIIKEKTVIPFTKSQKDTFINYYLKAGLLKTTRRPFFNRHFGNIIFRGIEEIFKKKDHPVILDLGCGLGTQSLLFALLGAEVIAIDCDLTALQILRSRKSFYEQELGKSLRIEIFNADVLKFDYNRLPKIDFVFSLFAFNLMQPSSFLIGKISPIFAKDCCLIIIDGNPKHFFNRLFRKRKVLNRDGLHDLLVQYGFTSFKHIGGISIPPIFWRLFPQNFLNKIDSVLTNFEHFSVSYLHIIQKTL